MKNSKNYFLSFLFFVLLAAGCSSEAELQRDNIIVTDIASPYGEIMLHDFSKFNNQNLAENRSAPYVYNIRGTVYNRANGANGLGHVGVAFKIRITQNNNLKSL